MREDGTRRIGGAVVGDSELGKKKGEWRLFLALWFWERKNQRRGRGATASFERDEK
jgi:hypothetical protein